MRLHELHLERFGPYLDERLAPLAKVNVIFGPNGAGKSTIFDALQAVLTGTAGGGLEGGIGLDELRTRGADRNWVLSIKYGAPDGGIGGDREFSRHEGQNRRSNAQREIGLDADLARAALVSGELMRLKLPAAQRLLTTIARPDEVEVPAELRPLIKRLLDREVTTVELSILDQLQAAAKELRKAKRDAREQLGSRPSASAPADSLRSMSVADLTQMLTKIEQVRNKRQHELLKAQQRVRDLADDPVQANAYVEKDRKALKKAEADLRKATDGRDFDEELLAAKAEYDEVTQRHEGLKHDQRRLIAKAGELAAKVDEYSNRLALLTSGEGKTCFACDRPKLGKDRQAAIAKKWEGERQLLRDERLRLDQELQRIEGELQDPPPLAAVEKVREEMRASDGLRERVRLARASLEDAERRHERLAAKRDDESESAAADVADLTRRVAVGAHRCGKLAQYIGERKAIVAFDERAEELERDIVDLDRLVEKFGSKGLRANASGGGLSVFLERVRDRAAELGVTGVDFSPLVIGRGWPKVHGSKISRIAKSERMRVSLALQVAAAQSTGVGIVCCDDAESFADVRKVVLQYLRDASDVQSFLFFAAHGEAAMQFDQLARRFSNSETIAFFEVRPTAVGARIVRVGGEG